jgi:hypothetical protein
MGLLNWAKNKSSRMVGFDQIKYDTKYIFSLTKKMGGQDQGDDEIKAPLSKDQVESRKSQFLFYIKLNSFILAIIVIYGLYLFCQKSFWPGIVDLIVAMIPASQILRYHYLYTILKNKKFMSFKVYLESFKKEFK